MNEPEKSNWERQLVEKVVLEVYHTQRRERFWRILSRFLWIALLAWLISIGITSKNDGGFTHEHTAIVKLNGEINSEGGNIDRMLKGLNNAYQNSGVKGIIIQANSPGGSPVLSDIAYQEITQLKAKHSDIPLYIVAEDVCASGCYYLASAVDKIYANPSSIVGSIGVISGGFGLNNAIEKLGVERRLKTAGKYKGMGDPFLAENPETEAIWQQMLDNIHQEFINAVKEGRGKRLLWQENPDVFSGRAYTGIEAKPLGLIDDFGTIYSVSRDVIGAEKIIDYTPEEDWKQSISHYLGTEFKNSLSISNFNLR